MTRRGALVLVLAIVAIATTFTGRYFLTRPPPTLAATWRVLSRCLIGAPLGARERPSRRLLQLARSSSSAPGPRWPARCAPAAEELSAVLGRSSSTALGRFRERAARAAESLAAGRLPPDADALWADARAVGIDEAPVGDGGDAALTLSDLVPIGTGAARSPEIAGGPVRLLFRGPTRLCEIPDGPTPAACTPATLPPGAAEGAVRLVDFDPGGAPLLRALDPASPGVYALGGTRLAPNAGTAAYGLADGSVARVEFDPTDDYHVRTTRGIETIADLPIGPGAEFVFAGDRLLWLAPSAPGRASVVTTRLGPSGGASILILGPTEPTARLHACREGATRAILATAAELPAAVSIGDDSGFLPLERVAPVEGAPTLACGEGRVQVAWVTVTGAREAIAHDLRCDAGGCKGTEERLTGDLADPPSAAPLGDGVLVAWVAADGSLRARRGLVGALADSPELLLLDADTHGPQLEGFALTSRGDSVVVTVWTLAGTAAIRVPEGGDVDPVAVAPAR